MAATLVPLLRAPSRANRVNWRYIGAQTRHTVEKRSAWAMAVDVSAAWMRRSALSVVSVLTVGYT